MTIVLEGPDNAGKSTLATVLAKKLGCRVQGSEGPPKPGEDINDRTRRYIAESERETILFDRHPVVSQSIYSILVSNPQSVDPSLVKEFYARKPTIVYCDPGQRGLEGHVEKSKHDTEEHLAGVKAKYLELLRLYREWALKHAHFVYRITDGGVAAHHLINAVISHHRPLSKQLPQDIFHGQL